MKITRLAVADLACDPRNARVHSERNLGDIRRSLARFGQRFPILVADGVVIAGNARLAAARELDWEHIDTVDASDMTAGERRAFALADNRSAEHAEWDEDELAIQLAEIGDIEGIEIEDIGWTLEDVDYASAVPTDIEGFEGARGDGHTISMSGSGGLGTNRTLGHHVLVRMGDIFATIDRELYDRLKVTCGRDVRTPPGDPRAVLGLHGISGSHDRTSRHGRSTDGRSASTKSGTEMSGHSVPMCHTPSVGWRQPDPRRLARPAGSTPGHRRHEI